MIISGNVFVPTGSVGIGTAPSNYLDVKPAANIHLTIGPTVTVTGAVTLSGLNDDSSLNIPIEVRSLGTTFAVGFVNIASTLQVGGASFFATPLQIGNTSSVQGYLNLQSANGGGEGPIIGFTKNGQTPSYIGSYSTVFGGTNSDLLIYLGTTGNLQISGNVITSGLINVGTTLQVADATILGSTVQITGVTTLSAPITLPSGNVASFGSPVQGMLAYIIDPVSPPTFHGIITGGGSFETPPCYNGIQWICI